jgi:hypothetical protein
MLEMPSANIRPFPLNKAYFLAPLVVLAGIAANFMPELSIIILAALLFVYFYNHRKQLVIFLLIYTPFEELILKILPDSLYAPARYSWEATLFGLMVLMLFEKGILSKTWKKSPIDIVMLVFIGGWFISGFVNGVLLWGSLTNIKNIIRYIPLFYIIYNLDLGEKFLAKFQYIIIAIALFQSAILFFQVVDADFASMLSPREVAVGGELIRGEDAQFGTYYNTRFAGTLARNVHLGNYLAFALCFLTAMYIKLKQNGWLIATFIIIFSALVICSSRTSLISAIVGIGVVLVIAKHRVRRAYFISIGAALLFFVAFRGALMTGDTNADFNIISRLTYISSADYIDIISSVGRLYAIVYAIPAVFMSNPLLGIGPGSFIRISEQTSINDTFGKASDLGLEPAALRYVHDVGYAALFIQAGLIGLGALLWIFIKLFRMAKRSINMQTEPASGAFLIGATGFFATLAVQNFACFNLMYRNQSLLIWCIAGLVAMMAVRPAKTVGSDSALKTNS